MNSTGQCLQLLRVVNSRISSTRCVLLSCFLSSIGQSLNLSNWRFSIGIQLWWICLQVGQKNTNSSIGINSFNINNSGVRSMRGVIAFNSSFELEFHFCRLNPSSDMIYFDFAYTGNALLTLSSPVIKSSTLKDISNGLKWLRQELRVIVADRKLAGWIDIQQLLVLKRTAHQTKGIATRRGLGCRPLEMPSLCLQ